MTSGAGGQGGRGTDTPSSQPQPVPPSPRPSVPLPAAVRWFGATSLANDLASEIAYPLLPAFVTRTLGGGALALGLLDGVADAVAAGFKLLSGYLAERPRLRGPMVVGGYAIAAAVRPLLAMAGAAWHVVALRAADRVGKGVRTAPRDVMIAESVPPALAGRAFGFHRAADHTGAIVGPLLAAALLGAGFAVREVFWVAVVPGVVAVLLAMVAVRRASAAAPADASRRTSPPPHPAAPAALHTLVPTLALAAFLRAPETLLILRAQDLGVGVAAVPLLWALLHVVRSLASYPGGVLADGWGPRRTLGTGWVLYALLALGFAAAGTAGQAWAVFLAFGLVAALTESPERKLVAQLAPGRTGRGFGWYHAAISAAALPGAALFGWLYQTRGAASAFGLSAATTVVAILLLAYFGAASPARNA